MRIEDESSIRETTSFKKKPKLSILVDFEQIMGGTLNDNQSRREQLSE